MLEKTFGVGGNVMVSVKESGKGKTIVVQGFPIKGLNIRRVDFTIEGYVGYPESWKGSGSLTLYDKSMRDRHGRLRHVFSHRGKFENPEKTAEEFVRSVLENEGKDVFSLEGAVERAMKDMRIYDNISVLELEVEDGGEIYELTAEGRGLIGSCVIGRKGKKCGVEVEGVFVKGFAEGLLKEAFSVGKTTLELKRWCEETLPAEGGIMRLWIKEEESVLDITLTGRELHTTEHPLREQGITFNGSLPEGAEKVKGYISRAIKGKLSLEDLWDLRENIKELLGFEKEEFSLRRAR